MNLRAGLVALLIPTAAMATEQAFPPTAPGVNELKTLPAGTLLKAARKGNYFTESGGLFRPLFNYISSRDIKMTVPVEAQIDEAAMYFWVAPEEVSKVTGPAAGVEVVRMPARQVAARGARGGYSAANFSQAREELLAWLAGQTGVEAAGPAYAVYWHGPFTPWWLKRAEIHVPVRPRG
ncbi:MAG TPA: heme-binding protein [Lacunisphaera sp.]